MTRQAGRQAGAAAHQLGHCRGDGQVGGPHGAQHLHHAVKPLGLGGPLQQVLKQGGHLGALPVERRPGEGGRRRGGELSLQAHAALPAPQPLPLQLVARFSVPRSRAAHLCKQGGVAQLESQVPGASCQAGTHQGSQRLGAHRLALHLRGCIFWR